MGRSVAAVVLGYLALVVCAILLNVLMLVTDPGAFKGPDGKDVIPVGWAIVSHVMNLPFGVAAGYVTAHIARRKEMTHVAALAGLMIVMGMVSAISMAGRAPWWWTPAELATGLAGAWFGGRLCLARRQKDASHTPVQR